MSERRSAVATADGRASRTFALEQRMGYRYSAPVTNLRQRLKVVPPLTHGAQRRRRWQLAVQGVPSSSTRTFLDRFGKVTIDVSVPWVDDAVEFLLEVRADTDESRWPSGPVVDRGYLRPTRLTRAEGSVAELVPEGGDPNVASLCERVHRSLDYEWGITGVGTTASEALAGGRGVCQDYAHIMLAAPSGGSAAHMYRGISAGEGGRTRVEFLKICATPYRENRWVAQGWDPTQPPANLDYFVVAVGRDYTDVALRPHLEEGTGATNTLAGEAPRAYVQLSSQAGRRALIALPPRGRGPTADGRLIDVRSRQASVGRERRKSVPGSAHPQAPHDAGHAVEVPGEVLCRPMPLGWLLGIGREGQSRAATAPRKVSEASGSFTAGGTPPRYSISTWALVGRSDLFDWPRDQLGRGRPVGPTDRAPGRSRPPRHVGG